NITANWGHAAHDWKVAMNQFAILYGDRFTSPNTKKLILPSENSRPLVPADFDHYSAPVAAYSAMRISSPR
ncbi:hypothetical protein, partial [Pseudomonas savastanoi]|uniref:hypothetical protein n=1 Tax=Pseudomonas savastanoi TaxID=29438 RepID=UPI001969C0DA